MEYNVPFISDHASMLLTLASSRSNIKVPFKFFNVRANHEEFLKIVEEIWQQSHSTVKMKNIWVKLKYLRPVLKRLNHEECKFINQKIEKAGQELVITQENIHMKGNTKLLVKERELIQNLEKWSMVEESALQQKSKANWIKLRDSNTKFFSSLIKERTQRKQIIELTSLNNKKLSEPKEIKEEIVNFYKVLMGSASHTLPVVNKITMRKGPTILHQQRIRLCAEVTEQEIYECLSSIGNDKSPGVDGYCHNFFLLPPEGE
ncbi:uncharacterized protein LOC107771714 [Nicotiana tabacum]|uniref:Uncharacterized protein LOC107771714 n=1 Tax=Nicotiana tabacum TaxID=4097 RepID=A0A1S3Y3D0_TOBAC|nr:PREDICTED: uncharacterized protein LOC107771714 [Nicotiana tabacum]